MDQLGARIAHAGAEAVIVAGTHTDRELLRRLSWRLDSVGVQLLLAPEFADALGARVAIKPLFNMTLLSVDVRGLTGTQRFLKGTFDRVTAVLALVLLAPALALIAVLIKVTSRGPVLFVSERIGQQVQAFRFLKFRTMSHGSEHIRAETLGLPDEDMPNRYRRDPRITGFGRFLRRWSLDELPQLVNVVAGTMSIVGPRPILPEEVGLLTDYQHRRHATKPGLTGLWQISGRKETSWADRMQLDLYYIDNWSLALDTAIMAKTLKVVLSGEGAY